MSKTMPIREIAKLCNVGTTTVRRWADIASANLAQISAKLAQAAKTKVPAQFTLDETIAIVRAGGNNTLAGLLLANVASQTCAHEQVTCASEQVNTQDLLSMAATIVERVADRVVEKYASHFQAIERKALPAPKKQTSLQPNDYVTMQEYIDHNRITTYTLKMYQYQDILNECYRISTYCGAPIIRSTTGHPQFKVSIINKAFRNFLS